MTLGPQVVGVRRLAGSWASWGEVVPVADNVVLAETEVVRASLQYPVVWALRAFLDNGQGPPTVEALIRTGLGQVVGTQVVALGPAPGVVVLTHVPATELVVSVRCPTPAAAYRIIVQAAPLSTWSPWDAAGNRR